MNAHHLETPGTAPRPTCATSAPDLASARRRGRRGLSVLTAAGVAVTVVGSASAAAAQAAPPSTASVFAGTLRVSAGPGHANRITVFQTGAQIRVHDALRPIQPLGVCQSVTPNQVRCPAALVQRIAVSLNDDNDVGRNATSRPSTLSGGTGNDIMSGAVGRDDFRGGLGTDLVSYADRSSAVSVRLDNLANDGRAGEQDNVRTDVENVTGGSGADLLVGSAVRNVLSGLGGNDRLFGLAGNDVLLGGTGNDTLIGGIGVDRADGGPQVDSCSAEVRVNCP